MLLISDTNHAYGDAFFHINSGSFGSAVPAFLITVYSVITVLALILICQVMVVDIDNDLFSGYTAINDADRDLFSDGSGNNDTDHDLLVMVMVTMILIMIC